MNTTNNTIEINISLPDNDWKPLLEAEIQEPYFQEMNTLLINEYMSHTVFPSPQNIFKALELTPYNDVKVVILGQDPYHGPDQAHGLSFSVKAGIKIPPSLRNIYKELHSDLDCAIPNNGYLEKWATQGVLLLNTSLTVLAGQANSHKKIGWHLFTDRIISILNDREDPVVFILWGNHAQSKIKLITNERHLIIQSVHPSPLSARRGFFGSQPFSKTNAYLCSVNKEPIDWQINDI